jgi:hypothetical protein
MESYLSQASAPSWTCRQALIEDPKVQKELKSIIQATPAFKNEINRALHCVVAHLYRYDFELDYFGYSLDQIQTQQIEF